MSAVLPWVNNATFEATRRLIDCALARHVDFVLLTGDLYDAACGARAPLFLM